MCGRFYIIHPKDAFEKAFSITGLGPVRPRYNIAPTQKTIVAGLNREGDLTASTMRWGLVPSWSDDTSIAGKLINARSETAHTKPAFRQAFARRRCVVPASGFFEWHAETGGDRKTPYAIARADEKPLAFVGLYERWRGGDHGGGDNEDGNTPLLTFTILTMDAAPSIARLHHRQPVMLSPDNALAWLADATLPGIDQTPELEVTGVSTRVNSPKNDDAAVLEPAADGPPPGPAGADTPATLFD